MKIFKLSAIFAILAFVALSFTACDDNSTTDVTVTPIPNAPTALKAVSVNDTTVSLSWTASTSVDSTWFSGYELTVTGGAAIAPVTIGKTATTYTVHPLVEGTVYTFTLKAKNTAGEYSTSSTSVTWSPATRFVENGNGGEIKVYATSSSFGSGLRIFSTEAGAPMTYKVSSDKAWDLGIKTSAGLIFGSASKLGYSLATTPNAAEITDAVMVNSLNNDYSSESLAGKAFSEKTIDLSNVTGNCIVYARVKYGTTYNYARIFIKAGSNGLLQGSGDDQYLQMEISYQKVADTPYAK